MARKSPSSGVLWQVLAPVLRWPLASPRRLGSVLLAIVVACLLLSLVNGRSNGQELSAASLGPGGAATPAPSITSSGVEGLPGSAATTSSPTGTGNDVDAPVSDRYVAVARDFTTTYLAVRSTDPAAWQQRVKPLVSDALYPGLVAMDPNRVTTATLSAVKGVSPAGDGGGIAQATLSDNQILDVTVSSTPAGALVVVAFAPHT